MTLYEFLNHAATMHTTIQGGGKTDELEFDLVRKSISSGRLCILREGKLLLNKIHLTDGTIIELDGLIDFDGDPYAQIERLYAQFKRSVPNRHEKLNRGNFKALSSDSLTMEELTDNMPRIQARYQLEGFILLASAMDLIPWQYPSHFFWQSPTDPDCIVYRDWILRRTAYDSNIKEDNPHE